MSYLKDMPRLSYWFQKEDESHMEQSQMVLAKPSLDQLTPSLPYPHSSNMSGSKSPSLGQLDHEDK